MEEFIVVEVKPIPSTNDEETTAQDSASSIESFDTESCQLEAKISRLEQVTNPEITEQLVCQKQKNNKIISNIKNTDHTKFIDLISFRENDSGDDEKIESYHIKDSLGKGARMGHYFVGLRPKDKIFKIKFHKFKDLFALR